MIRKIALVAVMYGFMGSFAFSAGAGKVLFSVGVIELYRNGQWQQVGKSQVLQKRDTLRTGKKSTAILQLASGATIKMKPETVVLLSKIGKETEVRVDKGGVFSRFLKKNEEDSYKIKARTMTAAVRGTEFFFAYGKSKKNQADLWLCVNEGVVNVSEEESKSEVDVKAGEGIFIPSGKAITPPKPYEWTKTLNWNLDPKKGDVKDTNSMKDAYKNLLKQNYD